jgi:hypothetical protein
MLAVTSAVLTDAAHAAAGGGLPSTGLTALVTVGVAAAGIGLAGRRRSPLAVLAVLGAAQLATHVLLSVETLAADQGMTAMHGMPFDGVGMIGAHAIAVLLSAGLLAKADAAVFTVAAVLAMVLPTVLCAPPVPTGPARTRPFPTPVDRATVRILLRRSIARRGPPVTA